MRNVSKERFLVTAKFKHITKEIVYQHYVVEKLESSEIAKIYGCSISYITKLLKTYDIPKRRTAEEIIDKEELYNLYYIQNKSAREIGKMYGYSKSVILRLFKKHNIVVKQKIIDTLTKEKLSELYLVDKMSILEISKLFRCSNDWIEKLLIKYQITERRKVRSSEKQSLKDKLLKEELNIIYHKKDMTSAEIAKIYNCHESTIVRLLRQYGIQNKNKLHKLLTKELLSNHYYEEDLSMADIANIYNCATTSVENLFKRYNLKPKELKKERVDEEEIKYLYLEQDMTIQEIGEYIGISGSYLKRIMDKLGIPKKPELKEILTKEYLQEMYIERNLTTSEIATMNNCCPPTVLIFLKNYGFNIRKNNFIEFGHQFETISKQIFEVLNYQYIYHYDGFSGIIPDFYDELKNEIIDCKLSSFTPFFKSAEFFEKYSNRCEKVVIVYLNGRHIEDKEEFTWRHISYYYPELYKINRRDLIDKITDLENEISKITDIKNVS